MKQKIDNVIAYTIIMFFIILSYCIGMKNMRRLANIMERNYNEKNEK